MALVLNWERKLGYRKDPFVDIPARNIIGLISLRERINLFLLKNHRLGLIAGEKGMGKTSFVCWLKKELRGQRRIREVDLKIVTSGEKLEAFLDRETEEIYKKVPFFDKIYQQMTNVERTKELRRKEMVTRLKKEPVLLIIENASKLTKPLITVLNELLLQTKLEILLLDEKVKNPFSFKQGLKVLLNKYSEQDMTQILQQRIEKVGSVGTFPFDNKELKKLFKKADGNPRTLLAVARERAIELSLKGLPLPEKPKPVVENTADKLKSGKKKFNLFGNIKIEVHDDEKVPRAPAKKRQKAEHSKKEEDELSEESLEDAELLKKMVEEGFK